MRLPACLGNKAFIGQLQGTKINTGKRLLGEPASQEVYHDLLMTKSSLKNGIVWLMYRSIHANYS